jgi:hypothetical protein
LIAWAGLALACINLIVLWRMCQSAANADRQACWWRLDVESWRNVVDERLDRQEFVACHHHQRLEACECRQRCLISN